MNNWEFWSMISFMGIAQALLILILFALDKKKHILPNLFVGLLLLWIIWLQAEFLVIRRAFVVHPNFFFGSRHGVWFLLGPLVYHYLFLLFNKKDRLTARDWLHYIPFLLFVLVLPLTGKINISDRIINYGMLSVLKFPMLANSWLDTVYGYVFILQFIHAAVYLMLAFRSISEFQKENRQISSDNRQEKLTFLKGLILAMGFTAISSVLFIVVLLNSKWYVREMDYIYILPLTCCVYLLSFFAIQQPASFRRKEQVVTKYQQSSLEQAASIRHFENLKSLIVREKLYLNPELRLMDLSEMSGVNYHHVSEVINKEAGVSFFEFINQFRVDEVLETIKTKSNQNQRINILEIAFSSGFNNKVSFNRYFKKKTGQTPTAFIKKDNKRG
jgi:AraC-like DNA-binding protein